MSDPKRIPAIELEGAANAPILVFDEAPFFGVAVGMGRVTLTALIQDEDGRGGVRQRRVAVAHLRGNALAFTELRNAINGMETLGAPVQGGEKPN